MSDTTRRDAKARVIASFLPSLTESEVERMDDALTAILRDRDTAIIGDRDLKPENDPRDVIGDGAMHAPDELGGES